MTKHSITTDWKQIIAARDEAHNVAITVGVFSAIGNVVYLSVGRHEEPDIILSSYTTFGFVLGLPADVALYAKCNSGTAELATFEGDIVCL